MMEKFTEEGGPLFEPAYIQLVEKPKAVSTASCSGETPSPAPKPEKPAPKPEKSTLQAALATLLKAQKGGAGNDAAGSGGSAVPPADGEKDQQDDSF
ncbi:MAG: hypothetical protein GY721_07670 [Deltaproteobacteria bacterium]|nr:hypothetical protein [Deltaproteobacteria bacterium]